MKICHSSLSIVREMRFGYQLSGKALAAGSSCGVRNRRLAPCRSHTYRSMLGSAAFVLAAVCLGLTGCGTNKFEQEVQTEEAAIKLTNETVQGGYQLISTPELKALVDGKEDFLLVDAMPAGDSYDKGHIKGAVNFAFPKEVLDSWDGDSMDGRVIADYEKLLGDDKDRLIVVYCGFVKCARSHNAAAFAQELGFTNVKRYPGGIYAWRGAGHDLTTD
jgi:thiosulfate/3-mercaptopyruvate sulfurtransferase